MVLFSPKFIGCFFKVETASPKCFLMLLPSGGWQVKKNKCRNQTPRKIFWREEQNLKRAFLVTKVLSKNANFMRRPT